MSEVPSSGLGRRAVYAVLATGLEKAVALGIALYLPRRHLGLEDYGRYTFVLGYLNFFQVLPDAALEAVLMTRLAAAGSRAAAVAGRGAAVRLATSLVSGGLGLGILDLLTGDRYLVRAAAVWGAGLLAAAANPYRALLRAELRMDRYLALLGVQGAIALGVLAAVVHAGGGLIAVLGAVSMASACGSLLGRALAGPGAVLRADPALARTLAAAAWPVAGTALALIGAQQVLQVLLLRLHGAAEVGLLGGAQKLAEAVNLVPQAVMVTVLPALAVAETTARSHALRGARDAARMLVVVLLPIAGMLVLWAGPILSAVLGPHFDPAALTLRILAATTLLTVTGAVLTNLLVAIGLQRTLFAVTAALGLAMVALGVVLVPRWGAPGAAFSLVSAMLGGQALLCAVPVSRDAGRAVLGATVRPVMIGALAVAVAAVVGPSPGLAGVAVVVAGYGGALLATGTVTRAELGRWMTGSP